MAANIFNILPEHDQACIHLNGDMSVALNTAVSDSFVVSFFTTTAEWFAFDTSVFKFKDLDGVIVSGLMVGGVTGAFLELRFDPVAETWYITANNLIVTGAGGGDGGVSTDETPITFAALPAMTVVDYSKGKNRRGKLTADAKLANPIGMVPGDTLKIVIEQDTVGSRKLTYDGAYGWKEALIPNLSIAPQTVDILDCYMTSDYTLQCDLRLNYSVVRPIAYINDFVYTMALAYTTAQTSPITGQTVQVIRDGWRGESTGTIGFNVNGFDLRVKGVPKANGAFPELKLDHTDRPSFGKAMINIEGGRNVVIEDLKISGTSTGVAGDGNGTGVLINNGVDYVLVKNVHLYDNEDGVRSGVAPHPEYDLVNVFLESNGRVDNPIHAGYSHGIYAGECGIWRGIQSTWYNSIQGHNIKTRALITVLKQVYSRKSNQGREIDCCDQGVMRVEDSVFWKEATAANNNLISIGAECLSGVNRVQEYFFINCYFHNDVDPGRTVTYLENLTKNVANSVAVHFIDCLFGGIALTKVTYRESLFSGPYTITLTGGPLGPRKPVGSTHKMFNMAEMDPNASPNPLNITTTPFEDLPPMSTIKDSPPYPTFVDLPVIPPLPSLNGKPPEDDKTPPVVSLVASADTITQNGGVTLTATATDNAGVSKVEFYHNDTLLITDTSLPYTVIESYTYLNNGTHQYKVKAYDFSNNVTTSNTVTVNVNIEPPRIKPTTQFNTSLQTSYDSAINGAVVGEKRTAGATALQTALGATPSLCIYRSGERVVKFVYDGQVVISDDGYDVYLEPSATVTDYQVYMAADLSTGDWWYELCDTISSPTSTISGSVGGIGSGADLILEQNPALDVSFNVEYKFILPRTLDNLV